ncbi:HAMP domain-containing histidine kinase [Candidatus Gracilibacteria bacterium]|nr:HAMP domain-containing histidine kinase [Candidatus Gracilibacteria bacterium]
MFKNLKTSDRISLSFSLFTLAALFLLLLAINIIYFFIWYDEQKQASLQSMTVDYGTVGSIENSDSFKQHILTKDTIIIPEDNGALICSDGIAKKLHGSEKAIEDLNNSLFYREDGKIFFIFSKYYAGLGEVKILFDTTQYIKAQLIIIKISLVLMLLFSIAVYFLGKVVSKRALSGLISIAAQAKKNNLEDKLQKISVDGPGDDEIKILANTINTAFKKINTQTSNLKQFITDVSHEFKTPLMGINSKIDLYNKKCEKGTCSPNELQNLLLGVKGSTKKLNKLLETLFLFSRMQDGITCFDKKSIDLGNYIIGETDSLITSYKDKDIDIRYKINTGVYKEIESSTFGILLDNLLTNAIKFSNDNIRIEVGLTQKSFWVKDNGVGIEKQNLSKIWDKFYRNDLGKEGFGVGLFIVKRIIDLYKWKIDVKSKKGSGTKFEVFFK